MPVSLYQYISVSTKPLVETILDRLFNPNFNEVGHVN